MKEHLGTNRVAVDTDRFAEAFPSIVEKHGLGKELDFEVSLKRPRVTFGPQSGENCAFTCEIRFGLKELGSMNYIVYDQLQLDTKFNLEISEETLLANFMSFDITKAGTPHDRVTPIYSDDNFTEQEYAEFWDYLDLRAARWFEYLNDDVFGRGVPLPYWKLSFLTKLSFHPRAVLAVVSLFYN